MKKILFLLASFFGMVATGVNAQIITTTPSPLQEESENVVLTYHADSDLGNGGLKGFTGDVYVHIGAITTNSKSGSDWKYGPSKWGDNAAKYKLTRVATDTYELRMGDIREYFGMKDANEHVKQIACVFRSADCNKEGKTKAGGDIYVDIAESGFQMQVLASGPLTITQATDITFNVTTTRKADIELKLDGVSKGKNAATYAASYTINFAKVGVQKVVVTATYQGETITEELTVYYPSPSPQGNYPGGVPKMGYTRNADGSVTFCLAAPNKKGVIIVGSWNDYKVSEDNLMKYQDYNGHRYFWINVQGLEAGKDYPYYFLVDGSIKVGDPYARLVLDPWADKWLPSLPEGCPSYPFEFVDDAYLSVYNSTIDDYKWSNATLNFKNPEKTALNVYELLIRDFTGEEGENNGSGTIAKMHEKLDYLESLGVNCVELLPVMEFNGNNSWGYNTNFYMALDKAYGMPNELRAFIDDCHKRGMAVVLDIVFNHCDGHPWYHMYGGVKNNPLINENAPHDYSVLNDWNQDNAIVQKHFEDVLKYWMTAYKVDGFRFDLVKGLGGNNSYTNGTEDYNQSRVDNMKRFHAAIKSVRADGLHINEFLGGAKEENAFGADGQMNWLKDDASAINYAKGEQSNSTIGGFYAPVWGRGVESTVSFMESHDEERVAFRQLNSTVTNIGRPTDPKKPDPHDKRMRRLGSIYAQLLMQPGAKMIWQFGEFGYDESISAHGDRVDPETIRWNYLDDPDRKGLWDNIQAMMWLRRDNPELFRANVDPHRTGFTDNNNSARTIRLQSGNKEVIVFINPSTTAGYKSLSCSGAQYIKQGNCQLIAYSYGMTKPELTGSGTVSAKIMGNSFAIFASNSVVGVEDIEDDLGAPKCDVYGANGEIVIEGDYNTVEVYNAQGMQYNSLHVPAGLYIVRVDGVATKVLVR